jgi:hypothetical protein
VTVGRRTAIESPRITGFQPVSLLNPHGLEARDTVKAGVNHG